MNFCKALLAVAAASFACSAAYAQYVGTLPPGAVKNAAANQAKPNAATPAANKQQAAEQNQQLQNAAANQKKANDEMLRKIAKDVINNHPKR